MNGYWVDHLPTFNATCNALAFVFILSGYVAIRKGNVHLHKRLMLTAYGISAVFLVGYLSYHALTIAPRSYTGNFRVLYYFILITHILLAATVPVLTTVTIRYGLKNNPRHRKWARVTFPIWLYVSITGVMIYLFLV